MQPRRLVALLAALACCAPAAAQDPPRPPERVDETERAAEALRKLLGLRPGPAPAPAVPGAPFGPPPPPGYRFPAEPPPFGPPPPQGPPPPPQDGTRRERPFDELDFAARRLRELGAPPAAERVEPAAPAPYALRGSLTTRYRLRAVGDETDQEAYALLSWSAGDAAVDPFSLHFTGRGYADLDGAEPTSRLRGIEDTHGEALTGRVYTAHADLHALGSLGVARLGRQTLDETPVPLHLDGLRLETAAVGGLRAWAGGHLGVPVHLFESSRAGDLAAGVAAGAEPWPQGRVRADWLHLEDRLRTGTRRDELLGLALWQGLGPDRSLHLAHTRLGSDARDLTARLDWALPGQGLRTRVAWYQLLETQRALVTELDPFFEALLEYDPYHQLTVGIDQQLGDRFGLSAGADVRRLRERDADRPFNREFERYYLGPTARGLFGGGFGASLTGELWHTAGERIETVTATAEWAAGDALTLAASSSYLLYKLDLASGAERDHVRTWALRLTYRPAPALRFDLRYELEDADLADFQTFSAGMTWKF